MYMSMRRCDARLQAVPNPYYTYDENIGLQISNVKLITVYNNNVQCVYPV